VDTFERAGLVFPVQDHGAADGEPVVLLHGFPQDGSSYDRVVPRLTERGFRVLVPTQRGYAATARPLRRSDYRMPELVADVTALLDAAGLDRVHLVGHDWGGAVAWSFAIAQPSRVITLTALSTPHPAAMAEGMVHSSQALKSWYMGLFQLPWLPEQLVSRSLVKTLSDSGLPKADATRYVAAMTEPGALTAALNWYRGVGLPAPWRKVPDVSVPTTFVWGDRDFALGRYAAEHTAEHVTADYTFEPLRAGHWLPETRPEQVAAAIIDRAGRAA